MQTVKAPNERPEFQETMDALLERQPNLHKHALKALKQIFAYPVSHDLKWADVNALLKDAGAVTNVSAHQKEHVELNGVTRTFRTAKSPVLDTREVLDVRHFLLEALVPNHPPDPLRYREPTPLKADGSVDKSAALVIDYYYATLYRLWLLPMGKNSHSTEQDAEGILSIPQLVGEPVPDNLRHVPGTPEMYNHSKGKGDAVHGKSRTPTTSDTELYEYFGRVANTLLEPERVLVVGHGDGHSNTAESFTNYLSKFRPALYQKVVGQKSIKQDTRHMTRHQFLHFARAQLHSFDQAAE